jgi:flagellar motor switch protein FliN
VIEFESGSVEVKMSNELVSDKEQAAVNGVVKSALSNPLSRLPVTVQVMLGTARLPLSQLLTLQAGSEITLETSPDDPVVLMVNGFQIAKGNLYVLDEENDRFGIKITELIQGS